MKASIVSPAWAGSTPQLCLLMKPQAGSQAAVTKAHNCVGWPRRTGWKGEARPVPTGCVGGMTAEYSYVKLARYGRGCTAWNEDVERREGSRAPFCSSQD